jgi:hypothetical protein
MQVFRQARLNPASEAVSVLTHNIPKSDEQHLSRVTEKNFVAKYQ